MKEELIKIAIAFVIIISGLSLSIGFCYVLDKLILEL